MAEPYRADTGLISRYPFVQRWEHPRFGDHANPHWIEFSLRGLEDRDAAMARWHRRIHAEEFVTTGWAGWRD